VISARAQIIGLSCLCGWLLIAGGSRPLAEEFAVNSVADSVWQSRDFEQVTATQLLRAGLLVIQDMGFQVTEAEMAPGLLVAHSYRNAGYVLTASVVPIPGEDHGVRVRLTMAAHRSELERHKSGEPDYGEFYQGFFNHLNSELFRSRSHK
jgi:hypothetical protein